MELRVVSYRSARYRPPMMEGTEGRRDEGTSHPSLPAPSNCPTAKRPYGRTAPPSGLHSASGILHHAYPVCGFSKREPGIPPYRPTALLPDCPAASRVPGTWDPIPGTESTPRAEYRAPKTEGRTPENAPIGFASCMPNCRTALLPNGPMALWPYCPTIGLVDHA
jgi:hypothetical protein